MQSSSKDSSTCSWWKVEALQLITAFSKLSSMYSYGSPDYVHTDITGQQEKEARPIRGPCVEYSLTKSAWLYACPGCVLPLPALHFSVCEDLHRWEFRLLTGMSTNILHDGDTPCPNIRVLSSDNSVASYPGHLVGKMAWQVSQVWGCKVTLWVYWIIGCDIWMYSYSLIYLCNT